MIPPAATPLSWSTPARMTGDKGDTGAKGATGDIGPRGIEGTSITGVTEYYLATTASSGVTTGTAGWGTTTAFDSYKEIPLELRKENSFQ